MMSNQSQKTMMAFCFIISWALCFSAASLRGQQLAEGAVIILPFRIENVKNKAASFFPYSSLRLQRASHFILRHHRNHPLQSIRDSNRLWQNLGYTDDTILSINRAKEICRKSQAGFLLAGSAYIYTKRELANKRLKLRVRPFFCRRAQLGKPQTAVVNSPIQLQSQLRKILLQVTTFLKPRQITYKASSPRQKPIDIIALLDLSGSMRTDLPQIFTQLTYFQTQLAPASRLGIVAIRAKDRIENTAMTENWLGIIRKWRQNKTPRGNTTYSGLQKALQRIKRYKRQARNGALLVLTDMGLEPRVRPRLLAQLQALKNQGLSLCFFPLLRQAPSSRSLWQKVARNLEAYYASNLIYGRQVAFNGGDTLFFAQKGKRFFVTNKTKGMAKDIRKGKLRQQQLQAIHSVSYAKEQLNLDNLPAAFAKRQRRRLVRIGAYVSNLPSSMSECIETSFGDSLRDHGGFARAQNPSKLTRSRLLARSSGRAFWLDIDEKTRLVLQKKHRKKQVYLGLHWQYNAKAGILTNQLQPLYVYKKSQPPLLFTWTWPQLQRALHAQGFVHPDDVWFMELEILRIEQDERQDQDIRD